MTLSINGRQLIAVLGYPARWPLPDARGRWPPYRTDGPGSVPSEV